MANAPALQPGEARVTHIVPDSYAAPGAGAAGPAPEEEPGFFSKKLGPLPMWVWLLAGGGLTIFFIMRARSSSSGSIATGTTGLNAGDVANLQADPNGLSDAAALANAINNLESQMKGITGKDLAGSGSSSSGSSSSGTSSSGTSGSGTSGSTTGASKQYFDYVVKGGDTLWGLAVKYLGSGARYKEIKGYSGDPKKMPIGTVLHIPKGGAAGAQAPLVSNRYNSGLPATYMADMAENPGPGFPPGLRGIPAHRGVSMSQPLTSLLPSNLAGWDRPVFQKGPAVTARQPMALGRRRR